MNNLNIHLLVDYYVSSMKERQQEIDSCYLDNIKNSNFIKVHTFTNDPIPEENDITVVNPLGERLDYFDYFKYAKDNIPEGDIVVLANSDMYFDDTLNNIAKYDLNKHVLTLTRWASQNHPNPFDDGHHIHNGRFVPYIRDHCSQDVWVWKNPLNNFEKVDCNFKMGLLGCDNKIAYAFSEMGYTPLNPSLDIITYHNHATGDSSRTYERVWLSRPYLFVPTLI